MALRRVLPLLPLALLPAALPADMVDPSIDGFADPFCYLAKPSGLLGGVGAARATQVTWDGALYTGEAELCFVIGDPPRPVAVRLKRLGGGHVPLVRYSWVEGDVQYSVSAFAVALAPGSDPANFVRLQMTRLGDSGQAASIGCALRYSGLDHRAAAMQKGEFSPSSRYAFDRGCAVVDDRAACVLPSLPAPSRRYAVAGEPYTEPFTGADHGVGPATAVLLAMWDLGDQQELTLDLRMPWTPLPLDPPAPVQALRDAEYDAYADQVAEAWKQELARGMRLFLPEDKALATYQANLACLLMSTELPEQGRPRIHDHLRALALPPGESALAAQALDRTGRPDLARDLLEAWLDGQQPDGGLSPAGDLAEHCRVLIGLISHAWLSGDRAWAEATYAKIKGAGDWINAALDSGQTAPGSQAWLLAMEALGDVGELAALVGKADEAATWRTQRDRLLPATEGAVTAEPLPEGTVPAILELSRALPDSPLLPFLAPEAEGVGELCRRLRGACAEGLATEAGLLSPLRAIDLARLHAARGEQEQAIRDLYAVLVHTGSCQEGFAGGVRPWANRGSGENWAPDPRFSAAYAGLVRDLIIREQRDELHLFSAFSPTWLKTGQVIGVHNAPTSFGLVTAAMQIEEGGATLAMIADWHAPPLRVVFHVPYCVSLISASADQPGPREIDEPSPTAYESADLPAASSPNATKSIVLRPDTTTVTLKWEVRPVTQLSYEAAVADWRAYYEARYHEYVNAGNDPLPLEPIPLR